MSICLRLAKGLAGPPSAHSIALELSCEIALPCWLIFNFFRELGLRQTQWYGFPQLIDDVFGSVAILNDETCASPPSLFVCRSPINLSLCIRLINSLFQASESYNIPTSLSNIFMSVLQRPDWLDKVAPHAPQGMCAATHLSRRFLSGNKRDIQRCGNISSYLNHQEYFHRASLSQC